MAQEPLTRRCAVLGSPVAHSLSPALHRAAYAHLGLPWTYDRFEVGRDGLASFLAGLDKTWRGLSLTMPLKDVGLQLCRTVQQPAVVVGGVNTILLGEPDGPVGHNTDVPGMVAALRERLADPHDPRDHPADALLLGAGATARATVVALADSGVRTVDVLARDPGRAAGVLDLGERLGVRIRILPWWTGSSFERRDLVVSTVPAGAADAVVGSLPLDQAIVVFDVVYAGWPTRLAQAAQAAGAAVIGGLDLLVHQAVLQVELMTGLPGPLEVMRAAGEQALRERAPGSSVSGEPGPKAAGAGAAGSGPTAAGDAR